MLLHVTLLVCVLLLVACGQVAEPPEPTLDVQLVAPEAVPTTTFTDPVLVEGQRNYDLYCAHCHGYDGAGQVEESIQQTLDLGMLLVPAHDSSGHTWMHPDQLLIRTVRAGIQNPLAQFPMPAFGEAFTDEQILGMIAYMRLWWTPEQRQYQRRLTWRWTQMQAEQSSN